MVNLLKLLSDDRVDDAIKLAKKSLEAGMNPARLLAGSGELMMKLRAHADFQDLPGVKDVPAIIHGPMVGNVTDTSAGIWVRTNGQKWMSIFWKRAGDSEDAGRLEISETLPEKDFTGIVEISNLNDQLRYPLFASLKFL